MEQEELSGVRLQEARIPGDWPVHGICRTTWMDCIQVCRFRRIHPQCRPDRSDTLEPARYWTCMHDNRILDPRSGFEVGPSSAKRAWSDQAYHLGHHHHCRICCSGWSCQDRQTSQLRQCLRRYHRLTIRSRQRPLRCHLELYWSQQCESLHVQDEEPSADAENCCTYRSRHRWCVVHACQYCLLRRRTQRGDLVQWPHSCCLVLPQCLRTHRGARNERLCRIIGFWKRLVCDFFSRVDWYNSSEEKLSYLSQACGPATSHSTRHSWACSRIGSCP